MTSNSYDCTGDGLSPAYRAGAELLDMEMLQFHPHRDDLSGRGQRVARHRGGQRGGGDPNKPKGRAVHGEVRSEAEGTLGEGRRGQGDQHRDIPGKRTGNGAVYLDVTHRGAEYIRKKLPNMYSQFMEFCPGVDITKEKMEVAPTLHYQMGGIRVEPESGRTKVVGLYAAGEVACGLHGANRLGGNSLGDILVFGRRAGLAAAEFAKAADRGWSRRRTSSERRRELSALQVKVGRTLSRSKERIAAVMWKYVGNVRTQAELEQGLAEILAIAEEARDG